jgi:hypothetical protein
MSAFRTKLLGFTALATLFAGVSYGQISITATNATAGALNLRGEGATEVVSPITFTIANGAAGAVSGNVTVFFSAPVTSLPVPPFSDQALLLLTSVNGGGSTAACFGPNGQVNGSASNTQLTFSCAGQGFAFGANSTTSATVSGVRVNASAVASGATLVAVTATPGVVTNSSSTIASTALVLTVGYVTSSLSPPGVTGYCGTANCAPSFLPSTPVSNYNTAQGNPAKTTTVPSFFVSTGDTVAGAFKTLNGNPVGGVAAPPAVNTNFSVENSDGDAAWGTRIQLAFGNVPAGVTLYVPQSITVGSGATTFTLNLVTSATASDNTATGAIPSVTVPLSFTAPIPSSFNFNTVFGPIVTPTAYGASSFPITASGGAAVAVYEVVYAPAQAKVSAAIPVWVTFGPSSLSAASGAITVLESYAPTTPLLTATMAPDFAAVTTGALNGSSIGLASTQILFPFVTSITGFDTGLALSNTTTDPFGTSPTSGACTLAFYGTGAPTPNTGIAAPGGAQASGTSNAFLASSLAPGFTGYVIANCAFPEGHGFAYIVYAFGTNNATTMGYNALILNRGPNVAVPAFETLGQ